MNYIHFTVHIFSILLSVPIQNLNCNVNKNKCQYNAMLWSLHNCVIKKTNLQFVKPYKKILITLHYLGISMEKL